MGSKGLLSHRFGKTVKSDSFDGNMTIWYHAAALLCLGRGTSVVVLDTLFLLYISRTLGLGQRRADECQVGEHPAKLGEHSLGVFESEAR